MHVHHEGRLVGLTSYDASSCPAGPYSYGAGDFEEQCVLFHFWSPHPGGSHFAMCDGSVQFMSYSIDAAIIPALATRAGGEVASLE